LAVKFFNYYFRLKQSTLCKEKSPAMPGFSIICHRQSAYHCEAGDVRKVTDYGELEFTDAHLGKIVNNYFDLLLSNRTVPYRRLRGEIASYECFC